MKTALRFINAEMKKAGIDYHFQKNRKPKATYPYFVGELVPADPVTEDGRKEFTLILDGFNRESPQTEGTLLELFAEAEKIEEHFPRWRGWPQCLETRQLRSFIAAASRKSPGMSSCRRYGSI